MFFFLIEHQIAHRFGKSNCALCCYQSGRIFTDRNIRTGLNGSPEQQFDPLASRFIFSGLIEAQAGYKYLRTRLNVY